ncbi:hypothetical protein Tco_0507364, partial [Tanacetum coccineum]
FTEIGDSTTGTGNHLAGAGDSPTGRQGPAKGPAQPELPEEAGSSS